MVRYYAYPLRLVHPFETSGVAISLLLTDKINFMYCVMWTYQVPPRLSKDVIEKQFREVAGRYLQVPGLIRKYFGYNEDGSTVVGIYLWSSKDDANRFYSVDWMAGVKERWGAEPVKREWIVPIVAESSTGEMLT